MSIALKLKQRIHSSFARREAHLANICEASSQLCPPQSQQTPPAIYLPRDLERVTTVFEDTTMEQELARLRGGHRHHTACTAYELRKVTLSQGFLFKGPWRMRLLETALPSGPTQHLDHATLTGTLYGSRYFAHWLTDDLTLSLAAEITGGQPFIPGRRLYTHEPAYRQLFQIDPPSLNRATFDRFTFIGDHGQNSFKKQRYLTLRNRILPRTAVTPGKRVILRRGTSGVSRRLQNEPEIEDLLASEGFAIVDPSALTAAQLTEQCAGAEIVIGVEGSQLAHAIYVMAEGGILCAFQPPYRFNNLFKDYTDCLGLHYALLTGVASQHGFTISLDEIRELLDRLSNFLVRLLGRSSSQDFVIDPA